MADINILGHIEGIRYIDNGVFVVVSERRNGYKKKDGTRVDDDILTWSILYRANMKTYIASHFSPNMLVKVKGVVLPYAKTKGGNVMNGYTILGQTLDIAAYPTSSAKRERQMVKDSIMHNIGTPDLNAYNEPDF